MCYLGVEHIENTFGTLPKKTSSPLHLRPKRKNWAPRECMLSLLIGCMNFFNCQKWLWPFSTRANSLIGRRIPLIADSSIFSPIIKGWYLLGSLLERTPASFHEGGMGGRTRTHPGVPFWSSSFQERESGGEVHWPHQGHEPSMAVQMLSSGPSVCTFPFLGCMVLFFVPEAYLVCPRIVEKRP